MLRAAILWVGKELFIADAFSHFQKGIFPSPAFRNVAYKFQSFWSQHPEPVCLACVKTDVMKGHTTPHKLCDPCEADTCKHARRELPRPISDANTRTS